MRHTRRNVLGGAALLGALILAVPACGSDTDSSDAGSTATTDASGTTGSGPLVGTFEITAGQCSGTTVSGSYFRMVSSGETVAAGPFVPTADSTGAGAPPTARSAPEPTVAWSPAAIRSSRTRPSTPPRTVWPVGW